jgi:hypothetical protein
LPGLVGELALELPRVSVLLPVLLSVFWLDRWKPLFELPFSRPFPVDLPFVAVAVLPRAEKKC